MKHPSKQLTDHQKAYILKNYKRMSAAEMGRNQHAPIHRVRTFCNENNLDVHTPRFWKEGLKEQAKRFFNVDQMKEGWLV